jgi:hypothetical protein
VILLQYHKQVVSAEFWNNKQLQKSKLVLATATYSGVSEALLQSNELPAIAISHDWPI